MDLVYEYDYQGGALATPSSPETFHEMMDVAEALQNKDIHEKCFAGSGALVIWTGDGFDVDLNSENRTCGPHSTQSPL